MFKGYNPFANAGAHYYDSVAETVGAHTTTTGFADSKEGSISVFFKPDEFSADIRRILWFNQTTGFLNLRLQFEQLGATIICVASTGTFPTLTTIFQATIGGLLLGRFNHVAVSWNGATGAYSMKMNRGGTPTLDTAPANTNTIWTCGNYNFGGSPPALTSEPTMTKGAIEAFWLDNAFRDFGNTAILDEYVTIDMLPSKKIAADGSTPTHGQPKIWFPNGDCRANDGSTADFPMASGTPSAVDGAWKYNI